MDIIARRIVKWRTEVLWSRIEMIGVVLTQEEIAAEQIARLAGIRPSSYIAFQVRMVDINSIVEHCYDHVPTYCRLPGLPGEDAIVS
jgi:hypothetical protein